MSLLAEIQAKCSPELLASRDTEAIAAAVNAGRVRIESRMLSERGVLSALGPTAGDEFLNALEAAAASPDALPVPLRGFYGAIRRAVGWLKGDGIDVGDPVTRSLLDAMAATGAVNATSAAAIKRLAERSDPVSEMDVRRALWSDDGEWLA